MILEATDLSHWTLGRVFAQRVEATPDAPFLENGVTGDRLTYAQSHARALRLAAALAAHGVQPGERVGLMASNSLASLNCWFALNLAGAADVSINPANRGAVLHYLVAKANASRMLVEQDLLPGLRESEDEMPTLSEVIYFAREGEEERPTEGIFRRISLRPLSSLGADAGVQWTPPAVSGTDVASILFTSGTSGPAKGVMVTHAHALLSARSTVQGLRMTAEDTIYCFHPFFHMAAKHCGILAALVAGARCVIDRTFDATSWLDAIRRHRATVTLGHGPMLEMIYQQPPRAEDRETALRGILCAPIPRHIAQGFEERFGVRAIELWGMSEIGLPCWRPYDAPLVPGSAGPVLADWYGVRVVDPITGEELPRGAVGELRVRPRFRETVMAGYLGDAAATDAAWDGEWFRTGDSGAMDAKGWVFVLDRMTDRIRRRGENISPVDIEAAASRHSAVLECVAVGVPSGFAADEDIKLCVVLRPGQALVLVDMIGWLAGLLPHFMVPRYVEVLAELPRTPTNKVRRSELRKLGVTADTWDRKAAGIDLRQVIEQARTNR